MNVNLPPIDEETRAVLGEFLEAFLNLYDCPWIFKRRTNLMTDGLQGSKFMNDHFRDSIPHYQRVFNQLWLREKYKEALNSPLERMAKYNFTDTGLPFLQSFHLNHLIEAQHVHFATMVALFFLIANLTLEYCVHLDSVSFINHVVDCVAAYITRSQLGWIRKIGGWNGFCTRLVHDSRSPGYEVLPFHNFTAKCVAIIFTGKYSIENDASKG